MRTLQKLETYQLYDVDALGMRPFRFVRRLEWRRVLGPVYISMI